MMTLAKRARTLAIACCCAAALYSPLIHAADDYMVEYRAYLSAHKENDVPAALMHGEAAWRQAEVALGDHAKTATLAYNYARLAGVYAGTAESAFEAFGRALELSQRSIGQLNTLEVQIGLDELAVLLDKDADSAATRLASALYNHAVAQQPASDATARGWATLADYQLAQKQLREAGESAEMAVAHAESLQPINSRVLAQALITGAIADLRVPAKKRDSALLISAAQELERAIALFSPQTSLDSFDRTLAKALVWRESITALTDTMRRQPDGPGFPRKPDSVDSFNVRSLIAKTTLPDGENCPPLTDYMVTTRLIYPRGAVRKNLVGSVLFGFEIDGLKLSRAVVLAEPDGTGFGEATEQMLSQWTLKEPYPERCLYPFYMTYGNFVLR